MKVLYSWRHSASIFCSHPNHSVHLQPISSASSSKGPPHFCQTVSLSSHGSPLCLTFVDIKEDRVVVRHVGIIFSI